MEANAHFLKNRALCQTELFSEIVEQSPTPIMVTDAEGNLEYVNAAFTEVTGYSLEEVRGRNPRFLKSGKTPPEAYRDLWQTILSGRVWRRDLYNRKKTGELFAESIYIAPLRNGSGEISHFVGVWQDITERKRIEQLKDETIRFVAHELGNPLATVHEALQQVLEGVCGACPPQHQGTVRLAQECVERLIRMVTRVLDVTRIETGKMELNLSPFNLDALIREIVAEFQPVVQKKSLEIQADLPPEPLEIYADRDKVAEVVTNLFGNALKFTEKGSVHLAARKKGEVVECSVSDTGRGMTPTELLQLFGKYRQFGQRLSGEEKGLGLGLAISKGLVEAHSGKIWAESSLGKGTKITFALPARREELK